MKDQRPVRENDSTHRKKWPEWKGNIEQRSRLNAHSHTTLNSLCAKEQNTHACTEHIHTSIL